ncbi:slipin family protein [Candidatus Poribacteria bacterium]|nr:slipin family protein [Candidatus Poribacteria bacterium]
MILLKTYRIATHERGLVWRDRDLRAILRPGTHRRLVSNKRDRIETVSMLEPIFGHKDLELIVRSGLLAGELRVIRALDHERVLVWAEGQFHAILAAGLHAVWTSPKETRTEIVDARETRVRRDDLAVLLAAPRGANHLERTVVPAQHAGVWYRDGELVEVLPPGTHAFWRGPATVSVWATDMREQTLEVSGQEISTSDRVTLRLTALLTYRVVDLIKEVSVASDASEAMYREAQLAIRAAVGARELDPLLASKEAVSEEIAAALHERAERMGLRLVSFGIRDVILPGEMKELLNKVVEARKAAEASLITRREETAAMRMQANTAKVLEGNPVLVRLRELETLEKLSGKLNLTVIAGEKSLIESVTKLI